MKLQILSSRGCVHLGFATYPRCAGGHSLNHADAPESLGSEAGVARASGQSTKASVLQSPSDTVLPVVSGFHPCRRIASQRQQQQAARHEGAHLLEEV